MPEMNDAQVAEWKQTIDAMSHEDMCRLWRFAPPGHPVFISGTTVYEHFRKRYETFGGMTPVISKRLG